MAYPNSTSENSPSITVRVLSLEEIDEALALIHQSIRMLNAKDYNSQQIEKIIQMYDRAFLAADECSFLVGNPVVVAEQRSQLVGVAKAGFNHFGSQSIEAVFTHPGFVLSGVGRALVTDLEERATLHSVRTLSVTASLTAVGFYESLHYERIGSMNTTGNIPCVLMEKQLRSRAFLTFS